MNISFIIVYISKHYFQCSVQSSYHVHLIISLLKDISFIAVPFLNNDSM